jgi:2-methylcitrate dehydratase PrpD
MGALRGRTRFEDPPEAARHEGERAFANILGCMLGGSKAPGIDRPLAASQEFSGRPEATLIGRGQRADILLATLVNARIRKGSTPTATRIWRR